jgi:hypothetical protein
MSPMNDWLLTPMSPTPQSRPKDRAELRTADGEMMVVHISGNGAAISRCFWSGPLVARAMIIRDYARDAYRVFGSRRRNHNVFDVDQCANCDPVVGIRGRVSQ